VLAGFGLDGSGEGLGADFEGLGRLDTVETSSFPCATDIDAANSLLNLPGLVDARTLGGHSSHLDLDRGDEVVLGTWDPIGAPVLTSPRRPWDKEGSSKQAREWVDWEEFLDLDDDVHS